MSADLHGMAALYLNLFSWQKCWLSAGNHDYIHEVKGNFSENCVFTEPPTRQLLVLLTFSKVKVQLLRFQLQSSSLHLWVFPPERDARAAMFHPRLELLPAGLWGLMETLLSNAEASLRSSRTAVLNTAAPSWITQDVWLVWGFFLSLCTPRDRKEAWTESPSRINTKHLHSTKRRHRRRNTWRVLHGQDLPAKAGERLLFKRIHRCLCFCSLSQTLRRLFRKKQTQKNKWKGWQPHVYQWLINS